MGAACFGYSYIHETRNTAERLADAISQSLLTALDKAMIKTVGEVTLKPDQVVKLDPDAQVKVDPSSRIGLDASTTVVKLDPNAKISVTGLPSADIPRPSAEQLRGGGSGVKTPANTVVNFTVFRSVPHDNGRVVTGWNFRSNEDAAPFEQYCYWTTILDTGVIAERMRRGAVW